LNKLLKTLPEGDLSIGHCTNSTKWFITINQKQHYLKKSEIGLAKKLALKKYAKLKIKALEASLAEIKLHETKTSTAEKALTALLNDNAYVELLSDYFGKLDSEATIWANADYPKNTNHPESLVHPTVGGLMVRSKSESMIAIALSEHEIPFRYENLITIDDATFAPDFTILHPQTGQIMYWEHFGLMEDEKYLNDFSHKIMCYAKNQIYLGENLIATFETSDCPLDYQSINNKIKQFLK
jgi:hypothetical protein